MTEKGGRMTEYRIGKLGNQGNTVQEPEDRTQKTGDRIGKPGNQGKANLLYNCRECSTNRSPFLQNKANFQKGQNERKPL